MLCQVRLEENAKLSCLLSTNYLNVQYLYLVLEGYVAVQFIHCDDHRGVFFYVIANVSADAAMREILFAKCLVEN